MIARQSRLALLAALLAFLAVVGMGAVAGWHAASVHEGEVVASAAATVTVDHHAGTDDDVDGGIHLAAHVIGHGLTMPRQAAPVALAIVAAPVWRVAAADRLAGIAIPSLRRPPRG